MTSVELGKGNMAPINFVQFILDNVDLTPAQKLSLLNDFCAFYDFEGTTPEKKVFVNEQIHSYIKGVIHDARWKEEADEIAFEELELEEA